MATHSSAIVLGDRSRWETVSTLSARGPGRVLQVRERGNAAGDRFALKELKAGARTLLLRRFAREIEITRELAAQHRGIVPVVDYGLPAEGEIGTPWYVMPLAERSLENAPEFEGDLLRTLALGITLAEALSVAHHRVVHRDLKPGNVLVATDRTIQVADFGICYLADDRERITGENAPTIGTRQFVAPELLGGGAVDAVGARADVYSLGKTLYAVLAGGAVFPRERHRDAGYLLTTRYGDVAFDHFHGLLDRMVVEDPEERFADMTEVHRHLERAEAAIRAGAVYQQGLYGHPATPPREFEQLTFVLTTPADTRRRAILANAIDRAVELATAHALATSPTEREPDYVQNLLPGDPDAVARCGNFLLSAGAAFLRSGDDDRALEWVARLQTLMDIDPARASRVDKILCDAAVFALLAEGALAWRYEAIPALETLIRVYVRGAHHTVYMVTQAENSAQSATWLCAALERSDILAAAEPWVQTNAAMALGLVTGVAMLHVMARFTDSQLDGVRQNPNEFDGFPFGDYPAMNDPYWTWFGAFARRCREAPKFATALQQIIYSPQRTGLLGACARLTLALGGGLHANYLRRDRNVDFSSVPGVRDWLRWVNLE